MPRPAMLVEIVTRLVTPGLRDDIASRSWFLALSTLYLMLVFFS